MADEDGGESMRLRQELNIAEPMRALNSLLDDHSDPATPDHARASWAREAGPSLHNVKRIALAANRLGRGIADPLPSLVVRATVPNPLHQVEL